jgi:hypothetical protein
VLDSTEERLHVKEIIADVLKQRPCPLDINKRRALSSLFGNNVVPLAKILVVSPAKEAEQAELLAAAFEKATPDQKSKVVAEIPAFEACFASAPAGEQKAETAKATRARSTSKSNESGGVGTEGAEVRLEQLEKKVSLLQEGLGAAHDKIDTLTAELAEIKGLLLAGFAGVGVDLSSGG